jgi:hypothetical protein
MPVGDGRMKMAIKLYAMDTDNPAAKWVMEWFQAPATAAEIDAATSDKFQRWARIGQAAEALMFANGGFEAWHRRQDGMVGVMSVNKKVIGTGNDLDEALADATKEGWLG